MKKSSLIGIVLIVFVLLAASATLIYEGDEPVEVWVNWYDGPGNYGDDDLAQAIAVDSSSGNVYVTGKSLGIGTGLDYATVAYNRLGNELWVSRYNGPADLDDRSYGIAVDSTSGHVYVTGMSLTDRILGIGPIHDYATVAYDSSGNELWVSRYNGPANLDDRGIAIDVDSSSGNVFVTGTSTGIGTTSDYATVAYDSSGNELWVKRYNGPENHRDEARAIAVDSTSGHVYVTGNSRCSEIYIDCWDCLTLAYDSSGNELWVKRYNGPGNLSDVGHAIAVDSTSGHVYVTGFCDGIHTMIKDYLTLAYDSSGNELWESRYNGPANGRDDALAIAVDSSSGNVYVTGSSTGIGTHWDSVTVAYDSSGNELWLERYNGPGNGNDGGQDIAVDSSSGNVYVTGGSPGIGTMQDIVTIAYDSSGNELWVKRYSGPGNWHDLPWAIAVDSSTGDVYVTGEGVGSARESIDFLTIKYGQKLNPVERITKLTGEVFTLVDEVGLNQGEANALTTKLDNALKSLEKGNTQPACNQMGAFINQVNGLINSSRLTLEQGEALIDAALSVIEELCE